MKQTISKNIKRLMDEQGYTVKDLADRLDVSLSAIRNYLKARNEPSKVHLYKLAEIFHVKVSDITEKE